VISDDGRYIAWRSTTNATSGASGNAKHIYWKDTVSGTTRLITTGADLQCIEPKISGNGRYVAFSSGTRTLTVTDASKLPTASQRYAVYLYDSQNETLEIVSLRSDGNALTGIGGATGASVVNAFDFSADGRYIVYTSDDPDAHPDRSTGMTASFLGIFRRDLSTGVVDIVNRNASGNVVDGNFAAPRISADGSRVFFAGSFIAVLKPANRMVPELPGAFGSDAFVKDMDTADVWWASKTTSGAAHDGFFGPLLAIDGDGDVVAFASTSNILVEEDSDAGGGHSGNFDIFRVDLGASGSTTTSLITKSPSGSGNVDYNNGPFLPGSGTYVAFDTYQVEEMIGTTSDFSHSIGVGTFSNGGDILAYNDWAAILPSDQRDYDDNHAGDGIDNLSKYVLGLDPLSASKDTWPIARIISADQLGLTPASDRYLVLDFKIRRNLPNEFSWTVKATSELGALSSDAGSAVQVGNAIANGDFDTFRYRSPNPISASGSGFINVVVTAE
jgi:Tol biopolymer transport system component